MSWADILYNITDIKVVVTVSTAKNKGFAKEELCWWRKTDLTMWKRCYAAIDTTFKFIITGSNDWTDQQIDQCMCLIGMLEASLGIDVLEGLSISLGKKLPCKMRGILEIGALVKKKKKKKS